MLLQEIIKENRKNDLLEQLKYVVQVDITFGMFHYLLIARFSTHTIVNGFHQHLFLRGTTSTAYKTETMKRSISLC